MIHTISSRAFTRDVAAAKQWADEGPVIITDRGTPAHVLLSIEAYRRLAGQGVPSLVQALAMPQGADTDLPLPPRTRGGTRRVPDFDVEPSGDEAAHGPD